MQLSPPVESLIKAFEAPKDVARDATHLTVSRTVSVVAVLYEKIRNAVEFRAEHLVRRASIERILKRRVLLNGGSSNIAENLVVELLWARYIDSSLIDANKIAEIQSIIERYLKVKHELFQSKNEYEGVAWDTVIGIASSEIEETIVSATKRNALINFFYYAVRPKIQIPNTDEQYGNIQTYIAIERSFAQADEAIIMHHILKMVLPNWFTQNPSHAALVEFVQSVKSTQSNLSDRIGDRLSVYIRKQMPPFLLLRDFFFDVDGKCREIIDKPEEFEKKLAELATHHYQETGHKVRRAIVRSFIYIFLTKMVFAFALEYPYDKYIAHNVSWLALGINGIFPPVLLVLVAGLISVPGPDNTHRLIDRITKIMFHFDSLKNESDSFVPTKRDRRPILTALFTVLLLGMYALTFIIIRFALTSLHFSLVSQIIFVFFVALVTFFAYRIRHTTKEYEIVERQAIFEPLMDFFFLPILRAGHFLSQEIAKINVFIFLFDFILEAPLKVIFEVAEEWIRFVRSKKDEII